MISIIIPTYNSKLVLPNCLESLERSSSASNLQVIIVDNNSNDGTRIWLEEYNSKSFTDIVKVKIDENKGFAYACNRGVDSASGEIILLLNPDTVVSKDAIKVCQKQLNDNPNIGAIGCKLEMINGKLDLACRRSLPTLWNSFMRFTYISKLLPNNLFTSSYNLTYLDDSSSFPVGCISGAFMMMPRTLYEHLGGLDEDYFMYGEDIDLCKRIADAGYLVWYQGTVASLHIKGGNGGKKSKHSIRTFYDSMEIYYAKHFGSRYGSLIQKGINGSIIILRIVHIVFWYLIKISAGR